jgi:hypothetical protein
MSTHKYTHPQDVRRPAVNSLRHRHNYAYFGVEISDHTSGLAGQTDHGLRVLLSYFLCHGGESSQHLALLVTYDIPFNAVLHFDSLDGFFNFTLQMSNKTRI